MWTSCSSRLRGSLRLVITIRPATLDDLDFILHGNIEMALDTEGVRLDPAVLRIGVLAVLEGRVPGRYWVAERDEEVVGQLLITYEWSDWRNRMVWWIQSVYVSFAARRLGVFRALFQYVREEARAAGAGGLRLYVDNTNGAAQKVYTALGMNGGHYRVFEDMF